MFAILFKLFVGVTIFVLLFILVTMLGKLITKEGEPEDKCAENGALMVLALLFIVVGIYCSWVIGSFIVNWAKTIL